jgi:hypothetical protein
MVYSSGLTDKEWKIAVALSRSDGETDDLKSAQYHAQERAT